MFRVEQFKVSDQGQVVRDNHGELSDSESGDGPDLEENSHLDQDQIKSKAKLKLPGFGLPVNYTPEKFFPSATLDWSGTILTVRELNMMTIMDKITDKPDWDNKVSDDTIVQKWRLEALGTEGMDVSEKMLDWVCTAFS